MKKFKIILISICLLLISGCNNNEILGDEEMYENIKYNETTKITDKVEITISEDKKILIELYKDIAPISVKNFQKLVNEKFYDGVIFHRVINNFMIQTGENSQKEAKTIKGEFKSNGIENNLSHERGIVSMARTNIKDSASSQFFIVQADSTYLDGEYAAFGKVIAGMNVVDEIAKSATDSNDKPLKDIKIEKIRFIKVIENE